MSISPIASTSYMNFSNYRNTNTYGNSQSNTSTQETSQQKGVGGPPPGGKPPGGPPPGGKGQGPDLDTDEDGSWSASELDAYASYSSTTLGIELDSEAILSKYDTDGDGTISASERQALAKENAFNLPSPKDTMKQMEGYSNTRYTLNNVSESSTDTSTDSESSTNAYVIRQLIAAYNQGTTANLNNLTNASSTFNYSA